LITTGNAYAAYRAVPPAIPARTLAWNVYGAGLERLGRDGRPEWVDVTGPRPDQLLVRVDAVGLCFSDVKLIRLGGDHPKLYGRDLSREPTRLGHETAVTVVRVGDDLGARFRPGQRLAIQPDIYTNGRSTAYGYTIPGGLIGYQLIGPEVLAADDGAYVSEVDPRLGYAETALTEPWACVEGAYTQRRRLEPLLMGRALVVGRPGDERRYRFGEALRVSREIVLSGISAEVENELRSAGSDQTITRAYGDDIPPGPFDDIVMLGPRSADAVRRAADALAFRGLLNLVGDAPLDGLVEVDVGRMHYHYTAFVGSRGPQVVEGYGMARNRAELLPGGTAVFIGAAGPMGQMHLERALRSPAGPTRLIGVDLDADRLAAARKRLEPIAIPMHRDLQLTTATGGELKAMVAGMTAGRGADDVIVTAPGPAPIAVGSELLSPGGMLVVFAGVPVGTRAALDLSNVFLNGTQYTGTSGSTIADQQLVIQKTTMGQLSPARAVAAVAGMEAAADALRALVEGRYPGKIVVFPQLHGLALTSIEDLATTDPEFASAMADGGVWTTDAEALLFSRFGHGPSDR
jgi:threonine dehydrogenase-like Zn-dependent dehydrogenase